jgi:hypothetical protein
VKEFLEKIVRIFTTPINIENHDQKYQRSSKRWSIMIMDTLFLENNIGKYLQFQKKLKIIIKNM